MKISVSFLGQKHVEKTILELDKTDADFIHVDIMDGKYVPNKSLGFSEIQNIGYFTKKRLDVHFMVKKPLKYIDDYASLNVFCMTFHLDSKDKIDKIIERVKLYGVKVGIALNPHDDISLLIPFLDRIDLILIMGVNPGYSGQTFIMDVLPKIRDLRKVIDERHLPILLSVDGGVNEEICSLLKNVDIIVSGSYITNSSNYQEQIMKLRGEK